MKNASCLTGALLLTLCIGANVHAQTSAAGTMVVERPWARATPPGVKIGAAYMTLINNGTSADRLLGATTPLADKVQFHKETEDNGISRMREVPAVEIAPAAKVTFRPGDMHMMVLGLKQPLKEGQNLPAHLAVREGRQG